jgi:hypothetical protein
MNTEINELTECEKAVLEELRQVYNDSPWGQVVKHVCANPTPVSVLRLFYQLKSQACDNPEMMKGILGKSFKSLITL